MLSRQGKGAWEVGGQHRGGWVGEGPRAMWVGFRPSGNPQRCHAKHWANVPLILGGASETVLESHSKPRRLNEAGITMCETGTTSHACSFCLHAKNRTLGLRNIEFLG